MPAVQYDFGGKTVLVTGASRGIGYGIARGFVDAGADVTILAETPEVHEAATKLSSEMKSKVHSIQCDITDVGAVRDAMNQFDHIDVTVNNAGLERITPILDEDVGVEETFRRIVDINMMGTFYVTRYAARKMLSGSAMIFTCSIWSRTAVAEFSAYCATKHANLGFMRSMAQELAPKGIRVNGVCPGWVRTEASMLSLKNMSDRTSRTEQDLLGDITGAQIIDGLLEPDDMISTYLFLASDAASNIVGQAIMVDRGEVMA
ncbi:MAG: SDR family oxidoreductase [Rhodospirillales bacterium]|nr:SDR family oxidoreductase [Rhodospirillales bacterium]